MNEIIKYFFSINIMKKTWFLISYLFFSEKPKTSLSDELPRTIVIGRKDHDPDIFPRIIWSYWRGKKSPCAEACIKSIISLNPNFEVRIVNEYNLYNFLPEFPCLKERISVQHFSDLVRLMLLERYGGIWIDYSTIVTQSLDWVPEALNKHRAEVLAFYNEFPDEYISDHITPIIENGFIASYKNSSFIERWRKNYQNFLEIEMSGDIFSHENFAKFTKNFFVKNRKIITYLKCHVAAQKTMAENNLHKLILINAEDDYLSIYYKITPPRNKRKFAEELLIRNYANTPLPRLIKIVGGHRQRIDEYIEHNCYKRFSLLGKYISK